VKLYLQLLYTDGQLGKKMQIETFIARDGPSLDTDPRATRNATNIYVGLSGSPEPTYNTSLGHGLVSGSLRGVVITVGE
jgi:hypothetical protein